MKSSDTILILDRDSELAEVLSSYFMALGYKVQFTTRVKEALRRMVNQRFHHCFVDPDLQPDNVLRLFDELIDPNSMNAQTPLTLMTSNKEFLVPMSFIKRINSILLKPFSLSELATRT